MMDAPKIDSIGWLHGRWTGEAFGGQIEEEYNAPRGGCMMGTSRVVAGGKTIHKEFILLEEREGTLVYEVRLPSKTGVFKLSKLEKDSVIFEDPKNDFPRTIEYRKTSSGVEIFLRGVSKEGKPEVEHIKMKRAQ